MGHITIHQTFTPNLLLLVWVDAGVCLTLLWGDGGDGGDGGGEGDVSLTVLYDHSAWSLRTDCLL